MKLKRLVLQNFKGIKSFTLEPNGEDISVLGDNATGKTTIFDAFLWLLFDKDSQNKKDFDIKTLDAGGHPIHHLEHEVEGVFEVDGRELTLRKVYQEKWTKKRGSATKEFGGHTTDYFIDGVPVQKKDYTEKIASIVDEEIFKLLTSPTFFNNNLHWRTRRALLLTICGDISDADVIMSSDKLSKLPGIIGERKLDDHRKVIAARRILVNKELDTIPVRISEVSQGLPGIGDIKDAGELDKDLDFLRDSQDTKRNELARVKAGGEVAEKTKRLREIEGELIGILNQHRADADALVQDKQKLFFEQRTLVSATKSDIASLERLIPPIDSVIAYFASAIEMQRNKWHEIDSETFSYSADDTCPACGQSLPTERVDEAHKKAEADFNQKKAQQLEDIDAEGKRQAITRDEKLSEKAEAEQQLADAKAALGVQEKMLLDMQEKIDGIQATITDVTDSPAYQAKLAEKAAIEAEIEGLRIGSGEAVQTIEHEIFELQESIDTLEATKGRLEQHTKGTERIEELKSQEKFLAKEYERLEEELNLSDLFIRTKVDLLQEKINSRFRLANFKMFNILLNQGVEECCDTTYLGVPYDSLNNGGRINIGLDIINTLAHHYGFTAPIFIDNAEAVTQLLPTAGQQIRLVVSEPDKSLRVETKALAAV